MYIQYVGMYLYDIRIQAYKKNKFKQEQIRDVG